MVRIHFVNEICVKGRKIARQFKKNAPRTIIGFKKDKTHENKIGDGGKLVQK